MKRVRKAETFFKESFGDAIKTSPEYDKIIENPESEIRKDIIDKIIYSPEVNRMYRTMLKGELKKRKIDEE